MRKIICRISAVLALVAAFTLLPQRTQAANQVFTCSQGVQDVIWDGGGLFIDCIGQPTRFVAYATSRCPSLVVSSIDSVKLWQTLATSALLSGKTLMINYETACVSGIGVITTLTLSR